jgi:hypothetical protein
MGMINNQVRSYYSFSPFLDLMTVRLPSFLYLITACPPSVLDHFTYHLPPWYLPESFRLPLGFRLLTTSKNNSRLYIHMY